MKKSEKMKLIFFSSVLCTDGSCVCVECTGVEGEGGHFCLYKKEKGRRRNRASS